MNKNKDYIEELKQRIKDLETTEQILRIKIENRERSAQSAVLGIEQGMGRGEVIQYINHYLLP